MIAGGNVDALVATIREEANVEMERIRTNREVEIARLHDLPPPRPAADRERRLADARRRSDEMLAQLDWEERRRVIEQREAWIARVVARGHELLASAPESSRRDSIASLAREAVRSLRSGEIEIRISPNDESIASDEWLRTIATGARRTISASISGGCIVRTGPVVLDNSYEERARRLESEWRRTVAALYRV